MSNEEKALVRDPAEQVKEIGHEPRMDSGKETIEVRVRPRVAFQLYWAIYGIVYLVLALFAVLMPAGMTYDLVSWEVFSRLIIFAFCVAPVLVPPFAVFYFSERKKRWIVSDTGVEIRAGDRVVHDLTWDRIDKINMAPHGLTILFDKGQGREFLMFVDRKTAKSVFRVYLSKKIYLQMRYTLGGDDSE